MKSERLQTILWLGALPLFVFWLLHFVGASFFQLIFLITAFYWNLALTSETEEKKADSRKYRFSFLRLAYRLHRFLKGRFEKLPPYLLRSLSPLIFSLLAACLAPDWHPLFAILGSALFEATLFWRNKETNLDKALE